MNILQKYLTKVMNFYPPYLGAGIKIKASEDETIFDVSMKLTFFNKNYVGTHFGGSLYSMCDPFYMIIMLKKLGNEYIVWDKSGSIEFKKPGKGQVFARFEISQAEVDDAIKQVHANGKYEPEFQVDITNKAGEVIAIVNKKLWIKKK